MVGNVFVRLAYRLSLRVAVLKVSFKFLMRNDTIHFESIACRIFDLSSLPLLCL
jgi:hypothetical protein